MAVLANISGAAAELLMEAHVTGTRFGVELGGLFDKGTARELQAEGFGTVKMECETHGLITNVPTCVRECDASDLHWVFIINDAGTAWLDSAGKI